MSNPPVARLRRDLGRALKSGHPWLYADAVSLPGGLPAGSRVEIYDRRGRWLARGLYEPDSPIALRVWTLEPDEPLDTGLLRERLRAAAALRRAVVDPGRSNAFRLVHGEADRIPGLVCDVYADTAVIKLDTAALEPWVAAAAQAVADLVPAVTRVALRQSGRKGEGASPADERLTWILGAAPDGPLVIEEHGMRLEVDPARGHKTGLYLDQRENRRRVFELAAGRRVLNCFAYTGGFSVAAALGGASSVTTLDLAAPAVEAAKRNFALNGIPADAGPYRFIAGDAFDFLAQSPERYDLVIVDPPSMAASRASLDRALGAYRRLNRDALHRTAPGGLLFTASCSSHVSAQDLRRLLGEAAVAAGRSLRLLEASGAGPDHPTLCAWPEGDYLHALIAYVD